VAKTDTTQKGHAFEKKVAAWARKFFRATEAKTNVLFPGKTGVRPYEIDVWVKRRGGVLESDKILLIECKDRAATIKRTDISKFLATAKDVKAAVSVDLVFGTSDDRYWNALAIVSTARFDSDALRVAKENKIACYYYDGRKYLEENKAPF